MDGHREEDLLDAGHAADVADLRRRVGHPLEDLERMPVRAAILVDRHSGPIYHRG